MVTPTSRNSLTGRNCHWLHFKDGDTAVLSEDQLAKAIQLHDNKIHFCFINISQYNDHPLGYIRNYSGGLVVKNPPDNVGAARDTISVPGSGRFPWRRKWQPTPVFLPRESHGQRSLAGYSPWGCKELDPD